MSLDFNHLRIGKAGSPFNHNVKRASASCNTGGFYKSPSAGQSIEYTTPLNISWDTSCLTADAVDIYLYSPGSSTPRIHVWEKVYFSPGSYETSLEPRWWNSSSSISLQLAIVDHGTAPYLATLPAGPMFTATYTAPSSGTPAVADVTKADSGVTVVNNMPTTSHGLSTGKIAVAVIIPLMFIVALIVAAYFKISRERGREKRKRWSEAVDKRMSTISTDWRSISAAGASAAIRNSMAVPGNRASSFSFGAIRPNSTFAADGGQAGIGSHAVQDGDDAAPPMSQLRPGARTAAPAASRVSRVSFAADVRPSIESRRTVTSRAFHTGFVPPLPERQDSDTTVSSPDGILSPTQTHGPLSLSVEDIQSRLTGESGPPRPSMDEMLPALRMMQSGANDANEPEYLFSPQSTTALNFPAPPTPTHPPLISPASQSFMPMQPLPASVMSPDEMMRAYAERHVASPTVANAPAMPAASYGSGMRTLYSPTTPTSAAPFMTHAQDNRKSMAPTMGSRYSTFAEEDAYGGTA